MKTLLELTRLSESYLEARGVSRPRLESEWLIAETLKIERLTIYADYSRPVTEEEQKRLREALLRRGKREPLEYITGQVNFLDCTLKVNPSVLIPRPETELLAEKVIQTIDPDSNATLWDICCGSGAIGIAIKKARPHLTVILSDLSEEALEVAKENALINKVDVKFFQGDLLTPFKGLKTDFVVSNPPYVTDQEYLELESEVKDFEPVSALISGPTGREFYERLSKELLPYLNKGAQIWMELGPEDSDKYFKNALWKSVLIEPDLSGKPRYLQAAQNDLNFK